MPSWNELVAELDALPTPQAKQAWLPEKIQHTLAAIGVLRNRNVLFYGSAWLQKPQISPGFLQINHEDLNGFMSTMYGMDWSKGLTLLLHTPGGVTNAAETIVSYLRSKFDYIEVVVPTFAMSAGTMISLGANKVVMGRQSQLGPIDTQLAMGGRTVSARAIVEQFQTAKADILGNPKTANVWAPILQPLSPSLLIEAQNALDYGEQMVAGWLTNHMFAGRPDAEKKARDTARHFNDATTHKSHGRRIDRDEARSHNIEVEDLETDQRFQDLVLTAHHLYTLAFEKSAAVKAISASSGTTWLKNMGVQVVPMPGQMGPPGRP